MNNLTVAVGNLTVAVGVQEATHGNIGKYFNNAKQ